VPDSQMQVLSRAIGCLSTGQRAFRTECRGARLPLSSALLVAFVGLFLLFSVSASTPARATDEASKARMQSLDEQVQEIKGDVLRIAAELNQLEEKLLFPSNTQVAVFVSLPEADELRLDSAQIAIDGRLVAHHIYSFKELEALQKGGVQRIYTGNVGTGDHRLEVSIAGKLPGGGDFSGNESFSFAKGVEPRLLGVTLAHKDFGGASIELGDW
jgi:hypothetical protein